MGTVKADSSGNYPVRKPKLKKTKTRCEEEQASGFKGVYGCLSISTTINARQFEILIFLLWQIIVAIL